MKFDPSALWVTVTKHINDFNSKLFIGRNYGCLTERNENKNLDPWYGRQAYLLFTFLLIEKSGMVALTCTYASSFLVE